MDNDLVLDVEVITAAQARNSGHQSDGATGDSGENKDPFHV